MLTILNQRSNKSIPFKNYEQLYKHIAQHEKMQRSPNAPETLKGWTITRHSYQRVLSFCQYVVRQKKEKKGLDVLEICQGPSKKPLLIPVTSHINIPSLKEQWCRAYCEAHGYQLEEVGSSNGNDEAVNGGGISFLEDPLEGACPTTDTDESRRQK